MERVMGDSCNNMAKRHAIERWQGRWAGSLYFIFLFGATCFGVVEMAVMSNLMNAE